MTRAYFTPISHLCTYIVCADLLTYIINWTSMHSYIVRWHTIVRRTWLIRMCAVNIHTCNTTQSCVCACETTLSYSHTVCKLSLIRLSTPIHTCAMTASWRIHIHYCVLTYLYTSDPGIELKSPARMMGVAGACKKIATVRSHITHMNDSCHTHEWVMSHIWMSHVTCMIDGNTVKGACKY